jgi:prepilin-type N-terminal cleavage/methylation domain-containing protein
MMRAARNQSGMTLIELLMVTVIGVIVSTMMLLTWFALNRSYVYSINSGESRDNARLALARMQREVRDAQMPPSGYPDSTKAYAPIDKASPYWIAFFTTFNHSGNNSANWTQDPITHIWSAVPTRPHLVVYRLYSNGSLYRFEDLNNNGVIDMAGGGTFDLTPATDTPSGYNLLEETKGEDATLLLKHVVNIGANPTPTALFRYNYYDTSGVLQTTSTPTDPWGLVAVQIHALVDVNPFKAPVYVDLVSTAQLRNKTT